MGFAIKRGFSLPGVSGIRYESKQLAHTDDMVQVCKLQTLRTFSWFYKEPVWFHVEPSGFPGLNGSIEGPQIKPDAHGTKFCLYATKVVLN